MERFDDIYLNNYAGEILEAGLPKMFRPTMFRWDSYFSFMVDGITPAAATCLDAAVATGAR